jgi:hypothetical protein
MLSRRNTGLVGREQRGLAALEDPIADPEFDRIEPAEKTTRSLDCRLQKRRLRDNAHHGVVS